MHPIETSERPSPATTAPASSPAPVGVGQGVGTLSEADREYLDSLRPTEASLALLSAEDREQVEALAVLREMFYLQDRSTAADKARSLALAAGISALHRSLEHRGIDA